MCSLAKDRLILGVWTLYEALYRKYRPKTFDDVVGQEAITGTLKAQVRTGRLSHAYLFIGTRGTGKTTCARILAKAVNCEHPVDGNPCNQCAACRGIEDGSIMDVVELDAASNNGVDDVRMLRDEAIFSPTTVKKRVYIIDEVHMLSKPAFNALLKILEEPPEHLMFILATTELNKVLPTILSRCQRHSFRRLGSEVVAKRLAWVAEQEHIRLEPDAARLLGRLADGSMRDGLSLLDQCSAAEAVDTRAVLEAMGLAGSYRTGALLERIAAGDTEAALEQFGALWRDGKEPSALLSELAGLMRDALLLRLAPGGGRELLSGAYGEDQLAGIPMENEELLRGLNAVQKYQAGMRETPDPRLQAELCLIELCTRPAPAPAAPVSPGPRTSARESGRTAAAPREPAKAAPPPVPETVPAEPESAVPAEPENEVPAEPENAAPAEPENAAPAEAETPPAAEPESPAPENAGTPSAPAGPCAWSDVLRRLKEQVPTGIYMLLSDPDQVQGRMDGGKLVLQVMAGFPMTMVSVPATVEKLRACAAAAAGGTVPVRLEELKQSGGLKEEKLDLLGQFGNVTIK